MKAVKLNGAVCFYLDEALPEIYADRAVTLDELPGQPGVPAHLDIIDGAVVWVVEPATEPTTDDVLNALLGVNV